MGTELDLRQPRLERFGSWTHDTGIVDNKLGSGGSIRRASLSRTCVGILNVDDLDVERKSKSCPASPPGKMKVMTATASTTCPKVARVSDVSASKARQRPVDGSRRVTETSSASTKETAEPSTHAFTWAPNLALDGALDLSTWKPVGPRVQALPTKRVRALHDVDGPGTGSLPCKKRRIRYHLCTSRLSQPYSLPATHIHNPDKTPTISQFLRWTAIATKKAGHQPALVRKAAILNRVRINVRLAAVSRGHTQMASLAERQNVLNHGLQAVTAPASSTGARFPGHTALLRSEMRPGWRAHTTTLSGRQTANSDEGPPQPPPAPRLEPISYPVPAPESPAHVPRSGSGITAPTAPEEEDDVSFPAADLDSRYADLSDDDMDDVYADFGVLFRPAGETCSVSAPSGEESPHEEHFYEEYLDELDGIPWIT